MNFRIGQKVVCIRDGASRYTGHGGGPLKRGAIYTIKCTRIGSWDVQVVDLVEVTPGPFHDGFDPERFRPVVERKTDTGFAILEEIRQRESEPAPKVPAHTSPDHALGE